MEYIVVQAGGRGSRLGRLTANKPKALVPVENLPMLFHLFRKYPDKRFIIIADYKKEVLRSYLAAFADVAYLVADAEGKGTCAGIRKALSMIPEHTGFMLIWSDLILPDSFTLPAGYGDSEIPSDQYTGISGTFPCRWSYSNNQFAEERSFEHGVAGCFWFTDKAVLQDVPAEGEFVRWLSTQDIHFRTHSLAGSREFGLEEDIRALPRPLCRPFNRLRIEEDRLIKEPVDAQGRKLAEKETAWYTQVAGTEGIPLPRIYDMHPLTMELIKGKPVHACCLNRQEKTALLQQIVDGLKRIHSAGSIPADAFSMKEAYFRKTVSRLARIRGLIPFADSRYITVNGKKCRNVWFCMNELEAKLDALQCSRFVLIHGDCTFSNILRRDTGEPVFIDPRGYFGFTDLYGDERYDWAKLYYSIAGNYDLFNLGQFELETGGINGTAGTELKENEVRVSIASEGWEDMQDAFFAMTGCDPDEIRLLHAVIWLSLTTYAWQDYDSVCGAFYTGLYYLEDVL